MSLMQAPSRFYSQVPIQHQSTGMARMSQYTKFGPFHDQAHPPQRYQVPALNKGVPSTVPGRPPMIPTPGSHLVQITFVTFQPV